MTRLRVLVVEDSATMRAWIVDTLSTSTEFEVVGQAADGRRAAELCSELRPDVVTMDMVLPVMDGLASTEHIMAYCPTPILVVSSSMNRGELFSTYQALAAGAVDVFEKPRGDASDRDWSQRFLGVLRVVARVRVITHPRARLRGEAAARAARSQGVRPSRRSVVAIGASTGGPAALLEVIGSLPHDFQLPVLVVLHISEAFGSAFAEWLNGQVELDVRFAADGEPLPSRGRGQVLLAPPGRHLEVRNGLLRLDEGPERHSCRPSVDVLFESLAREMGPSVIACLCTGMGRDGAQGLLNLRQRGGLTLAQDRASSVVFGMPGEAVRLGAAERVLPLTRLGPAIAEGAEA